MRDQLSFPFELNTGISPGCSESTEVLTAPLIDLPSWFSPEIYREFLQSDPDFAAGYPHMDEIGAACERTFCYFSALNAALRADVGIVINSSTGKDSTLMTSLYVSAMRRWRDAGKPLRETRILVSDTGSEFPEMGIRMVEEVAALNRYAKETGLPLKADLVRPPAKHRLLVELAGNGKPLPKLSSGASRNGYEASTWCMSRVKSGVLDRALDLARHEFPVFVQCLGVRNAESAKRSSTIDRYAVDSLPAVSRLSHDQERLGFCPISHWDDKALRDWLVDAQRNPEAECPWRPEGIQDLVAIYTKGAGDKSENPYECALTITKDGNVSGACSDLTGTRLGCWMCMLSRNASLANTAAKDSRYVWLKKCHDLIYANHERNQTRVKLRDSSGFAVGTLFPKSFTFEERYRLLVHLFRAELESGFELLSAEDIEAIRTFWEKHGVFTVDVEEGREDAKRWKETGVLEFNYLRNIEHVALLSRTLSEGIPAGAWFRSEVLEGLNLAHLIGFSANGFGSPIVPVMQAYLFADRRKTDRIVVMVTDLPSVMGTRTNTGLLNNLIGAAWECINVRPPTDWERQVSDGRIFFYSTSVSEEKKRMEVEFTEDIPNFVATERFYANMQPFHSGCPDEPLGEWIQLTNDLPLLSRQELEEVQAICFPLAYQSDDLSYNLQALSRKAVRDAGADPDLLEDQTEKGKRFRSAFKKRLAEDLQLEKHRAAFQNYARILRKALKLIRAGKANCALLDRCCYIARMDGVDPEEGLRMFEELCRQCAPKVGSGKKISQMPQAPTLIAA